MTTVARSTAASSSFSPPYTEESIRALADAFERGEVSRAAWTHEAHLVVALWLLVRYGADEGGERVRTGIQRLNAANDIPQTPEGGYHETITRFYLWAIGRHIRQAPVGASVAELATTLVAAWGDRTRPFEYYSRERLMSWAARTAWVEPDLRELG